MFVVALGADLLLVRPELGHVGVVAGADVLVDALHHRLHRPRYLGLGDLNAGVGQHTTSPITFCHTATENVLSRKMGLGND